MKLTSMHTYEFSEALKSSRKDTNSVFEAINSKLKGNKSELKRHKH